MISWLILHHNRPFFLQICIDHLRKWGHPDWKIFVVDSGSEDRVKDGIKKLCVDDIYFNPFNDSSSSLMSGFEMCKGSDYIAFTEEDFIYVAKPLSRSEIIDHDLFPEISFHDSVIGRGYNEAIRFMQGNPQVGYVNMCNKKSKPRHALKFMPFSHHTNWPHLMRSDCVEKITLPANLNIANIEYHCQQTAVQTFGPLYRMGAGYHSHIGNWMSVNPTMTQIQVNIQSRCLRLAQQFGAPSIEVF